MRHGLAGEEPHLSDSAAPVAPILLSVTTGSPEPGRTLRLRGREWPPGSFGIMAVINRTPDSFFDQGSTYEFGAAMAAADRAVADGAGILDIGGVKAGPGEDVTTAEEIRRVAGLVAAIRAQHPSVVISVDTWRAEVGEAVARAGADLLNDAWGGADPDLARVAAAARTGAGLLTRGRAGPAAPGRTGPPTPMWWRRCAATSRRRRNGRSRPACARTGSSSTPPTTSARTPGTRWS